MHAVRPQPRRQARIGADQENQPAPPRRGRQPASLGQGARRTERARDHPGAARQPQRRALRVRRARRIGEEQQARQGGLPPDPRRGLGVRAVRMRASTLEPRHRPPPPTTPQSTVPPYWRAWPPPRARPAATQRRSPWSLCPKLRPPIGSTPCWPRARGCSARTASRRRWAAGRIGARASSCALIGPGAEQQGPRGLRIFEVIETLDPGPKLAQALAKEIQRLGRAPRLYVEVNTGEEPQKAGVIPAEADAFIAGAGASLASPSRA